MYKKFLTQALFFSLALFILCLPVISFAQTGAGGPPVGSGGAGGPPVGEDFATIKNPISATSVNGFIKDVLVGLLKIGIPLIAIAIIYSGFLFVTAQGKPGDIETAKRAFMYTIIGAAILLGAWAIAQLISDTVLSL